MNFNDESLNSRNPFSTNSSKRTRSNSVNTTGISVGQFIARKASYFLDFFRGETNDNDLVNARILDSNFNEVQFAQISFVVPRRNTGIGTRLDYAINTNHTLVARYNYNRSRTTNGIGGFSLPSGDSTPPTHFRPSS